MLEQLQAQGFMGSFFLGRKGGNAVWVYKGLYFLFFGTGAMMTPFLSLYLRNKGLTGTQLGILWAVGPLVTVLSQPVWGLISDLKGRRPVFLSLLAVNTVLALLYLPASQFWHFLAVSVVLAVFRSPVGAILDSFVLEYLEVYGSRAEYGKARLWGSVGWSSLSYMAGRVVGILGLPVIFFLNSLGTLVTLVLATRVRELQPAQPRRLEFRQLGVLLKNQRLVVFLLCILLLQVGTSPMLSFFPIYLDTIGAPSSLIGTAFLLEGLSEIPIFFISGWFISRVGPKWGIVVGASAYAVRMMGYSVTRVPQLALVFQLLHGLSFSLFFASSVNYVDSMVPRRLRTTGQTLLWATYWGIGAIAGNILAGWLFDAVGIYSLFRVGSLIALTSAALVVLVVDSRLRSAPRQSKQI